VQALSFLTPNMIDTVLQGSSPTNSKRIISSRHNPSTMLVMANMSHTPITHPMPERLTMAREMTKGSLCNGQTA
jgi:hypothetical protein